jgi:hypothetical protein
VVACVAERPVEERRHLLAAFASDGMPDLLAHASRHRVLPFVARSIDATAVAVPDDIGSWVTRTRARWAATHLLVLADLSGAANVLRSENIPFLVVKGPVLSEHAYPSSDLRMYGDLDVLVPPARFGHAVAVLRAAGATLIDRNWTLARAEVRGQLHLQLPLGTVADTHWHLVNRVSVRRGFSIRTESLFNRAREVTVGAGPVPTLNPVDMLLHLCLHTSLSGGNRLIWLKDIERAIATDRPGWDAVVERAHRWRAGRSAGIALARSRRTLGTSVPDDVLDALFRSRTWRKVGDVLDRRFPTETATDTTTLATYWAELTRDTAWSTGRALAVRSAKRIRSTAHGRSGMGNILSPSGTQHDEEWFFRQVASEGEPLRPGGSAA